MIIEERNIIDRINHFFEYEVLHYQFLKQKPVLIDQDSYIAEDETIQIAHSVKQSLHHDDLHAILVEPIDFTAAPVVFHYETIPYSQVVVLRQQGKKPLLLTANIIAVDNDKKTIVLQHRSPQSHVYPNALSIPGGGFSPSDNANIAPTASREFHEETGLSAQITSNTIMTLTQELITGSVQVNFLGAETKINTLQDPSWEGKVELIHFDALYETLVTEKWVPLGMSCVMVWLAMGAPGTDHASFGGLTAQVLYKKLLDKIFR